MTSLYLGNAGSERVTLDLEIVLRSNLLFQANSGGGKSYGLRRLIEQAYGHVPIIVIDPEGEFSTLREKYDFLLVGKGGDTPADIRSAKLLAHRILKLGVSAVCDIFELSKADRKAWVSAFIAALVDAPKELWRDFLIIIDEAHEFVPEAGRNTDSAAAGPLIDLAAKGRKRGYGTVAATQRLAKLNKDYAAELKNVCIGYTWIDIDRERAVETLGIPRGEAKEFSRVLKMLEPGNFYGLGRAISTEPRLFRTGPVITTHACRPGPKCTDECPLAKARRALSPAIPPVTEEG